MGVYVLNFRCVQLYESIGISKRKFFSFAFFDRLEDSCFLFACEKREENILGTFTVVRSLTHNIVLASRANFEYILIGKGIGFNLKQGDSIFESKVSSFYLVKNSSKMNAYERIVTDMDQDVLLVTEKAIVEAEKLLNHDFDVSVHMSLLDHVNFAVYRYKNNLSITNPFSEAYFLMYEKLYGVAQVMLKIINSDLGIELPEYEAESIVLHLHAGIHQGKISQSALYATYVSDSWNYLMSLENDFKKSESIMVARLITHLKFAFKRLENDLTLVDTISEMVESIYPESFRMSEKLAIFLDHRHDIKIPKSEVGYIALHIENLKRSMKG